MPLSEDRWHPKNGPHLSSHDRLQAHLFPKRFAAAIQRSVSNETGWDFSTPTTPSEIEDVLRTAGITTYVALSYAQKPRVASEINEWLINQPGSLDRLIPFATVHPDDEDIAVIVREAFEKRARGLKIHCPVRSADPSIRGSNRHLNWQSTIVRSRTTAVPHRSSRTARMSA